MRVALFHKYPPQSPLLRTVRDRLEAIGIVVVVELVIRENQAFVRAQAPDLSHVEFTLFLFELCSHAEVSTFRKISEASGKRMLTISRKSASWQRTLVPYMKRTG